MLHLLVKVQAAVRPAAGSVGCNGRQPRPHAALRLLVVVQAVQQRAALGVADGQQAAARREVQRVHVVQRGATRGPVGEDGERGQVRQAQRVALHAGRERQHLEGGEGRRRVCKGVKKFGGVSYSCCGACTLGASQQLHAASKYQQYKGRVVSMGE